MKILPPALQQTFYYALSLVVVKSSSLLFLPVVTRFLSPEEYGILDVILAFANISTIVLGFGLVTTLYRFVGLAERPGHQKEVAANILGLTLFIALLAGVFLQVMAPILVNIFPPQVIETHLRLIMLTLAMEGLIAVPLAWIRFKDDAKTYFLLNSVKELSQLALMYAALHYGSGVTGMLTAGAICSTLFATYLLLRQVKEHGISLKLKVVKKYFFYGWPVVISGLCGFALVGLDRWMIASIMGPSTLGAYAIALKFSLVATFLLQPFTMWWFPKRFMVFQHQGRSETARFAAMGVSISLISVAIVALLGPIFIKLFLPESYHGALQYLPWLLLLTVLKSMADLMNFGCYYQSTTVKQMLIQIASSTIALIGFYLFIPLLGVFGAIYTLLVAQLFRVLCLYWVSQRIVWLPYPKMPLAIIFGLTLIVLSLSFDFYKSTSAIALVSFIVVFILGYAFTSKLLPRFKLAI